MERPNIKDIAKLACVSTTTVSHVINNTRFVSEETRKKVVEVMESTGYQPNRIARSLRKGMTNTIGLILPDSSNPYFAELGHAIEDVAFSEGYNVILCNTEGDPAKELSYINLLYQKKVDGMIFVSSGDNPRSMKLLVNNQVKVVLIDRELCIKDEDIFPKVMVDNENGAYLATSYLISLGHKRIGCISGPSKINPSFEREIGYRRALRDAGIEIDEELIGHGNFLPSNGYTIFKEMVHKSEPPTAIFAGNDMTALGVLRAAVSEGLNVPEDISVIGFDDIMLANYTIPSLTTVAQPLKLIASQAIDYMIRIIKKEPIEQMSTILPVSLIVRGSCKERRNDNAS